jgi:preprotein translocase subunit SecG
MFCNNCGKQIKDGDTFCAYCGAVTGADQSGGSNGAPPQNVQQNGGINVPPPAVFPQQGMPYQEVPAMNPQQGGFQGQSVGKNKGLMAAVIALSVLLLAAVGVVILLLVKNGGKDSSSGSGSGADNAIVSEAVETTAKTKTTTARTSRTTATTVTTVTTTTTLTTTETSTTTTATTTAVVTGSDISDDTAASSEAMHYSTDERPTFNDFDWCYGQNGLVSTPPEGASLITNPYGFSGGWKSFMVYELDGVEGSNVREINNVNILINGDKADVTVSWYYGEVPYSEPFYHEVNETSHFSGNVTGGVIEAYGGAELNNSYVVFDRFWRADGKEYALGSMIIPSGKTIYIALVRK